MKQIILKQLLGLHIILLFMKVKVNSHINEYLILQSREYL